MGWNGEWGEDGSFCTEQGVWRFKGMVLHDMDWVCLYHFELLALTLSYTTLPAATVAPLALSTTLSPLPTGAPSSS